MHPDNWKHTEAFIVKVRLPATLDFIYLATFPGDNHLADFGGPSGANLCILCCPEHVGVSPSFALTVSMLRLWPISQNILQKYVPTTELFNCSATTIFTMTLSLRDVLFSSVKLSQMTLWMNEWKNAWKNEPISELHLLAFAELSSWDSFECFRVIIDRTSQSSRPGRPMNSYSCIELEGGLCICA